MKIKHLQSATQLITLGKTRLLTDPWLTQGEYMGSWFHYPPYEDEIPEYDYIYVSHIHPDHLSEETFKLLEKKPVLIHKFPAPFVKKKLEMWGFTVIELEHGEPYDFGDDCSITIYSADNCDPEVCNRFFGCAPMETKFGATRIDTLAAFWEGDRFILNTNDCPYALASETIREHNLVRPDVLLVGYAGAGPFPQCFEGIDLQYWASVKQHKFLKAAAEYVWLTQPKAYAPFAGTYILGSRLAWMNRYRGVPSLQTACRWLAGECDAEPVCFEQGVEFDVDTMTVTEPEGELPSFAEFKERIAALPLDYDNDEWEHDPEIVARAIARFNKKKQELGYEGDTKVFIDYGKGVLEIGEGSEWLKIRLDNNLFERLIRGPRYAHWNNAEIGSHLVFKRSSHTFDRHLFHCLCFLHE